MFTPKAQIQKILSGLGYYCHQGAQASFADNEIPAITHFVALLYYSHMNRPSQNTSINGTSTFRRALYEGQASFADNEIPAITFRVDNNSVNLDLDNQIAASYENRL